MSVYTQNQGHMQLTLSHCIGQECCILSLDLSCKSVAENSTGQNSCGGTNVDNKGMCLLHLVSGPVLQLPSPHEILQLPHKPERHQISHFSLIRELLNSKGIP